MGGWATSAGRSAHDGASSNRLFKDWISSDYDPNDVVTADTWALGGRSADLARNNAYMVALLNAFHSGVVGHEGLQFRSTVQIDADPARSDDERELRRAVLHSWHRATAGTSMDASGLLTWRGMQDAELASKAIYGEGIKIRCLKPNRPGRHSHATCWRVIHPLRISNPNWQTNSDRLHNGYELDADGAVVAVHVLSHHPNALLNATYTWTRVPLYDARGIRQVTINATRRMPEQIRGVGWAAPVMTLLRQLGGVQEAHVVAKRLQAALGMIVEVDNPAAAAAADRNAEVLSPNTRITPGKIYYAKRGSKVTAFEPKYSGQDYAAFESGLLQAIAAAFGHGLPWQFAMQQLTNSNMASSRAALMQAWRSFRREGEELAVNGCHPVLESVLDEDQARGRLASDLELERLAQGFWQPPPRLSTDDSREMEAALKKRQLGWSPSSVMREHGGDFDDEIRQTAEDQALATEQGVTLPDATPRGVVAPGDDAQPPADTPAEPADTTSPTPAEAA